MIILFWAQLPSLPLSLILHNEPLQTQNQKSQFHILKIQKPVLTQHDNVVSMRCPEHPPPPGRSHHLQSIVRPAHQQGGGPHEPLVLESLHTLHQTRVPEALLVLPGPVREDLRTELVLEYLFAILAGSVVLWWWWWFLVAVAEFLAIFLSVGVFGIRFWCWCGDCFPEDYGQTPAQEDFARVGLVRGQSLRWRHVCVFKFKNCECWYS